jgi:uncharacterized protein YbaP (TraB family)
LEKCEEFGVSIESIKNFTPFFAMNMLAIFQMQKIGFTPQGVDAYYFAKANQDRKKTGFLESVEFQMKLLYDLGIKMGDEYILQGINEMDKTEAVMSPMIEEWRSGDSKMINEMINKDMKNQFPNMYKMIFLDRNKAWLGAIEKYLATKDVEFIIVGLGHVYGDEGLLKSLSDKGYKVEYLK